MFYDKKVFCLLLLLFFNKSYSMDTCKTAFAQMTDSSAAKVFGLAAGSVIGYEVVHLACCTKFNSSFFWNNKKQSRYFRALKKGIKDSWKPALFIGCASTVAARIGAWPKLDASDLLKPLATGVALTTGASIINGLWKKLSFNQEMVNGREYVQRSFAAFESAHKAVHVCGTLALLLAPGYIMCKRYLSS